MPARDYDVMTAERLLFLLVRVNAGILLLAAPCALLPFAWMDNIHREIVGHGSLPDIPIAKYMARSLSLAYALHGTIVLRVTLNWARYRPMVPLLAWLHIGFGCAMLGIDWESGMPWWWTGCEGPFIIVFGLLILAVYRRADRSGERIQ
jgi:hypothetical protein